MTSIRNRLAKLWIYPCPTVASAVLVSAAMSWSAWRYSAAIETRTLADLLIARQRGEIEINQKKADDNYTRLEAERLAILRESKEREDTIATRTLKLREQEAEEATRRETLRQVNAEIAAMEKAKAYKDKAEADKKRREDQEISARKVRDQAIVTEYTSRVMKIATATKGKPNGVVVAAHKKERDRAIEDMASKYLMLIEDVKQVLYEAGIQID